MIQGLESEDWSEQYNGDSILQDPFTKNNWEKFGEFSGRYCLFRSNCVNTAEARSQEKNFPNWEFSDGIDVFSITDKV